MEKYKVTITFPSFICTVEGNSEAEARAKAIEKLSWGDSGDIDEISIETI